MMKIAIGELSRKGKLTQYYVISNPEKIQADFAYSYNEYQKYLCEQPAEYQTTNYSKAKGVKEYLEGGSG